VFLALAIAFLASGLTVLFTVPLSAGQVDGSLGRWLAFIGAMGGLALIAGGLYLLTRVRDAEKRHRARIGQVLAFQHDLRWHMSEMDGHGASSEDPSDVASAVRARRVIADALEWFELELPEYSELFRRPTDREEQGSVRDDFARYSNTLDEILLALTLRGSDR
jgi:hypothetical protein